MSKAPASTLTRDDLEVLISDVRDDAIIAFLVLEDCCRQAVSEGMKGYSKNFVTLMLTNDQHRALEATMIQLAGNTRKLEDAFQASTGAIN